MSELIVVETLTPSVVFKEGGGDPIIEQIKQAVLSVDRDISTDEGRKNIASVAYKVARSKTLIDEMGKTFASDLKKQTKAIDNERARIWDALEALQKEVRQPLTEFEEKEKARIANHEADLLEIENAIIRSQDWMTLSVEAMQDRLAEIQREGDVDRQEFASRFTKSIEEATEHISSAIEKRQKYDAEQAELERLRKAEADRLQREREEQIRAEAAEKATREAEERAAAEARTKAEKAEAERAAIEKQKRDAEERERRAVEAAKAAEEKARSDLLKAEQTQKDAAEKAEREKQEAIRKERERIEAAQKAERDAADKREADLKHRAKINNSALQALVSAGLSEDHAKLAVEAIAKRQIPHITISY